MSIQDKMSCMLNPPKPPQVKRLGSFMKNVIDTERQGTLMYFLVYVIRQMYILFAYLNVCQKNFYMAAEI